MNDPQAALTLLQASGLRQRHLGPLDLSLRAGECVALSGASGSGKTLLLRALADLDVHEGSLALNGVPCSQFKGHAWRRLVGLLPAESQWWAERIGEHFTRVDESVLQALGFDQACLEWQVARCSTGERQRLALARLLMGRPKVLLLDEPTASLDRENSERVERLLLALCREQGLGLLWVSHSQGQIRRVADRHYRIEGGMLQAEAVPA